MLMLIFNIAEIIIYVLSNVHIHMWVKNKNNFVL